MDNTPNNKLRYTVIVFTEDKIGLLNRIAIVFTRRHLNIDSLTTSPSEVDGIFRFTITTECEPSLMKKVVDQIEKLTEVLRAFAYEDKDVVAQEIAIYKVSTANIVNSATTMEEIIHESNARIIYIEKDYVVLEKTGYYNETQRLCDQLRPYGILEFARSGRVAVSKSMKELETYVAELNEAVERSNEIRKWKLKKNAELFGK